MKNEKNLWWVIILMFSLLMFGLIFTIYAIRDAYNQGYDDGIKEINEFIVRVVNEDHYINVYDPFNNKEIILMEYNHSKELCLKILEGLFE